MDDGLLRSGLWIILISLIVASSYLAIAHTPGVQDWVVSSSPEAKSPFPRVDKGNIHLYPDKVVIDIKDAKWATFEDSNSMDPVFDEGHYAIEIVPQSVSDIHVGDIISYDSPLYSGVLVHRVVEIGNDGEWYAVAKGDNNPQPDPGKVRFGQIQRVMAMIIY